MGNEWAVVGHLWVRGKNALRPDYIEMESRRMRSSLDWRPSDRGPTDIRLIEKSGWDRVRPIDKQSSRQKPHFPPLMCLCDWVGVKVSGEEKKIRNFIPFALSSVASASGTFLSAAEILTDWRNYGWRRKGKLDGIADSRNVKISHKPYLKPLVTESLTHSA